VHAVQLAEGALVGSQKLHLPASPVAPDDKQCTCFCFRCVAMVNWILFVGRVTIAQTEMAPVRSVPALCRTGSFGHNLVATGLKKHRILIVIHVKVLFQTGLQRSISVTECGVLALKNHSKMADLTDQSPTHVTHFGHAQKHKWFVQIATAHRCGMVVHVQCWHLWRIFFIVWVVVERAHNIIVRSKNFNDKVISTFAKFLLKRALFFIA